MSSTPSTQQVYSKTPTFLESQGIYSLHYPAQARHHAKYTLDPTRTNGTIEDAASTPRLIGESSIGITWDGSHKRAFALGNLTAPNGTKGQIDTTKITGTHKFYVPEPDNSGRRRVAVACGITEIGPSKYEASVLFISDVLDPFPIEGAEDAPFTDLSPSIGVIQQSRVDLGGWLI